MTLASLIIADHDTNNLNPATAKTVAAAQQLTPEHIDVFVRSRVDSPIAAEAARLTGVTNVIAAPDTDPASGTASSLTARVQPVVAAQHYSHVLAPNTTFGKDVLPRLAATIGRPMVTDLANVQEPWLFRRPIYAGNAIATIRASSPDGIVASIRTASFTETPTRDTSAAVASAPAPQEALPTHARVVRSQPTNSDRPDLQNAERVVVGGRGLGSETNFEQLFGFAESIGAAVGASRAAVDAGYAPNEFQVGQTGRIIAPTLYIGLGVSGAIQHLAGIKDAGTIVAVNKDPDAPIFDVADIGLVDDLFDVLPKLRDAFALPSAERSAG